MRRIATAAVVVTPLLFLGCATVRVGQFGPLPNDEYLVTLVVSDDRSAVQRECRDVPALGPIVGCEMFRPVPLGNGRSIRAVKIVRYAQSLPSPMTFEIDIHELCHAVAALQDLTDPCHEGNGGRILSAPRQRALR